MEHEKLELFAEEEKKTVRHEPLAVRMLPADFDEFVGQEHILGKDMLLRRAIETDALSSAIFFGPSGTGKSALAKIIAAKTKSEFVQANAVTAGVVDIRKIIETAKTKLRVYGKNTTLMLDEIHHFNRSQQDALLPDVERGTVRLVGITTENPYFYINSALLSRSLVFEFKPLAAEDLRKVITRALHDLKRGLGKYKVKISPDALEHIIKYSKGDARRALNAIEIGVVTARPGRDGTVTFDMNVAEESIQKKSVHYDKSGDAHYDHISAFIKSMRGSDPDAAVYWMMKMLAAGEDPRFIARRIVIAASEDVGNADPGAITVAISALEAVQFVGMPEAKIPLAQAAIYVACAPKSNASYMALSAAGKEVESAPLQEVPEHLKDSNLDGDKLGHGKGYLYPHDYPGHFVEQKYLPNHRIFYRPSDQGFEKVIQERLEKWRKKKST
jgi:putative ATPase